MRRFILVTQSALIEGVEFESGQIALDWFHFSVSHDGSEEYNEPCEVFESLNKLKIFYPTSPILWIDKSNESLLSGTLKERAAQVQQEWIAGQHQGIEIAMAEEQD